MVGIPHSPQGVHNALFRRNALPRPLLACGLIVERAKLPGKLLRAQEPDDILARKLRRQSRRPVRGRVEEYLPDLALAVWLFLPDLLVHPRPLVGPEDAGERAQLAGDERQAALAGLAPDVARDELPQGPLGVLLGVP